MNAQTQQRVLIVDDEPNVATMVAITLEDLGDEYQFDIAHNASNALNKLQQNNYALLITDYNMPGMSGLDLAQMVQQASPDTQIILMTAYGSDQLRQTIKTLKLDGYIDKPATPSQIREIVQHAINQTQSDTGTDLYRHGEQGINDAAQQQLQTLQTNTGVRCILLISSTGYPVSVIGATTGLDIPGVSALVAANFLAAMELANMLGNDQSIFKSNYYEGNDYNIYSYDINKELLLAVIFGAESKPGVVWFYTKQAAVTLAPLVSDQNKPQFNFEIDNLDDALDIDFDDLLSDDEMDEETLSQNQLPTQNDAELVENNPAPEPDKEGVNTAMSFRQAIEAGLVPSEILNREQDGKN